MKRSITAGIDFGNQSCVLSMPTRYGVDVVLNQSSNRKTPTIVCYDDLRRYSGEFASQQRLMNVNNTITQIKRLLSLQFDSEEREQISNILSCKIVCLDDKKAGIQLDNNKIFRPEQIFAYFLKSMLEIIQMKNSDIEQTVLTVPPSWTVNDRRLIMQAASISKVKIASFLNSTTAAAISYVKIHTNRFSDNFEKKINVLFVDVGDTSIDMAVSVLAKRIIDMKSFVSDKTIGGHFFTEKLNEYLIQKVQEMYKIDPRMNKRAFTRFLQETEKVKRALSANPIMMFEIPSLINDIDVSFPVKRDEFNQLFEEIPEKVERIIQKVLDDSSFAKEDINYVEFLGGSSRLPIIKSIFKEFFGKDPMMSLDLDECFAIGAGYFAALEDGYNVGIDTINSIYPYEIKAEFEDENEEGKIHSHTIFKKNSKMPSKQSFSFPVCEKNSFVLVSNDERLGCATIQTNTSEKVIVDVLVSIDKFGIVDVLNATYLKKQKGKEERINAIFSYSPINLLSNEDIEKFAKIDEEMSIKDKNEIEIDNTKNRLESLIFSTENELNSLFLINENDKDDAENIKLKVSQIHNWFEENEFERLKLEKYIEKISEIDEQINRIFLYKKYLDSVYFLNDLKQELIFSQAFLKRNLEKIDNELGTHLQSEVSCQISDIEEIVKLAKNDLNKIDISSIENKVNNICSKIESAIKNDHTSPQTPKKENISEQNTNNILKDDDNKNNGDDNINSDSDKENDKNSEKVVKNNFDQIKSQFSNQKQQNPKKETENSNEISHKQDIPNLNLNKKKINIVNMNNDELTKQNLVTRNSAVNPQKSRVKLPPMSPRSTRNLHTNKMKNRAARPILQNQKSSPSVIHPQSQRENMRYSARPRVGAAQPTGQQKKKNIK